MQRKDDEMLEAVQKKDDELDALQKEHENALQAAQFMRPPAGSKKSLSPSAESAKEKMYLASSKCDKKSLNELHDTNTIEAECLSD